MNGNAFGCGLGACIRGVKAPASLKPTRNFPKRSPEPPIRGVKAPASLKRVGMALHHYFGGEHPGCKSPGLIEAGVSRVTSAVNEVGIRGVKAPASLKLLFPTSATPANTRASGV